MRATTVTPFLLWLGAGFAGQLAAHDLEPPSGCAHYLGNEGVAVSNGDTKIVFDAFYNDSYGQYVLVPEHLQNALLADAAPFDGIDAVFVSHVHGDHFSPAPALEFLRAHPTVRMFASRQTAASLRQAGAKPPLMQRVTAFDLSADDPAATFEYENLTIDVVAIPHAGGERMADIQNLAFRVSLGRGFAVMHLGDAGVIDANFARHREYFDKGRLASAYPPYWFFRDAAGLKIVDEYLNADRVVGIHMPAATQGRGELIRRESGQDVFTDPGEARALGSAARADCQSITRASDTAQH